MSDYPSTGLAYEFVRPSYEWMLGRIDAAETRAQRVQVFAATLTFAAPVLVRTITPAITLDSGWFYAAVVAFVIILVLGVLIRLAGPVTLPSIKIMREQWLHLSEQQFRQDTVFFAAKHFDANHQAVNRRGNVVIGMTLAFGVEVLLFLVWWATS